MKPLLLTQRYDAAVILAARLHRDQERKGTRIPYLSHLLSVSALVLEHGGDEDQAIAALLHDAVEDQGGKKTLALIRRRFGDKVATIVDGCSDTDVEPKPPWLERKRAYIAHVKKAPHGVLLVSACDKLHNARSIITDLRTWGRGTLKRFSGTPEQTCWYYRSLYRIYAARKLPKALVRELKEAVDTLERLAV